MADKDFLKRFEKELIKEGKLIEAGWIGLRLAAIPLDASKDQLDDMRTAFFAGAQHLFGSIMHVLDPGDEPTEADLERMSKIHDELDAFIEGFKKAHGFTLGRTEH